MSAETTIQCTGVLRSNADVDAATGVTAYPTGSATGVDAARGPGRSRAVAKSVHVMIDMTVASGAMSWTGHLYGLDDRGKWRQLKALNDGVAIAQATHPQFFASATEMYYAEDVPIGAAYQAYRVRCTAIGGTTPVWSSFIGFEE